MKIQINDPNTEVTPEWAAHPIQPIHLFPAGAIFDWSSVDAPVDGSPKMIRSGELIYFDLATGEARAFEALDAPENCYIAPFSRLETSGIDIELLRHGFMVKLNHLPQAGDNDIEAAVSAVYDVTYGYN